MRDAYDEKNNNARVIISQPYENWKIEQMLAVIASKVREK